LENPEQDRIFADFMHTARNVNKTPVLSVSTPELFVAPGKM
jgi:hypothetical protein